MNEREKNEWINGQSSKKNFWQGNNKCKFGPKLNMSDLILSLVWQICPPHEPTFKNPVNTLRANSFPAWAVGFIVWNNKLRLMEILGFQMVYCNYFPHSTPPPFWYLRESILGVEVLGSINI